MAAGVNGSLSVVLSAVLTGAAIAGQSPAYSAKVNKSLNWDPGTAATDEANVLYHATRNLAAGASESLDVRGVLADALGATVNAAEICAIIVQADAGNGGNIRFGPAASNGFAGPFADASDRVNVGAGDFAVLTSKTGWAATAGTGDLLSVTNTDGAEAADYTVTLVGRSTAA